MYIILRLIILCKKYFKLGSSQLDSLKRDFGKCETCACDSVCGDEVCELEENCLNCPADCGICPMSIAIKVAIGLPVALFSSGFILTMVVSVEHTHTKKYSHKHDSPCNSIRKKGIRFCCNTVMFMPEKVLNRSQEHRHTYRYAGVSICNSSQCFLC